MWNILMKKFSYSKRRLFGEWDISKIKNCIQFEKYNHSQLDIILLAGVRGYVYMYISRFKLKSYKNYFNIFC